MSAITTLGDQPFHRGIDVIPTFEHDKGRTIKEYVSVDED
jgi:hypothetical protein